MTKLIGLSLSCCVTDILLGHHNISEVTRLITSTSCITDQDWYATFWRYSELYWYDFTFVQICRVLIPLKPLIEQPRLTVGRVPSIVHGYWVEDESRIQWVSCGETIAHLFPVSDFRKIR